MIPQKPTPEMKRRAALMARGIWPGPPDPTPERGKAQRLGRQKIAEQTKGTPPVPGK